MTEGTANLARFDHLVVLMMENRSFDNLLGYLYESDRPTRFVGRGEPEFRGVAGRNLANPDGSTPPRQVPVGKAPWATPEDMCHPCPDPGEFYRPHVNRQVYGMDVVPADTSLLPDPAPMSGFVQDYIRAIKSQEAWDGVEPGYDSFRVIMNCFTPEAAPVVNGLARAFAVSDEWFCSVPSQTFCNRSFVHSGQSRGFVTNSDYIKWRGNTAPTIFERLSAALPPGNDWRVYWDHQDILPLTRLIHPALGHEGYDQHFRHFETFAADCASGDLPAYTFIQPRLILDHNDMHPPVVLNPKVHSSVLAGELLVAAVYDAVRTGKAWPRTLLVITFDEHGGCYDHWPPPLGATPPDPNPAYPLEEGFRFDRFGVRVPTIFVSPLVAPGTVIRAPGAVPFDHTSLIRTVCAKWGLDPLTGRDRAAPDIGAVLMLSDAEARLETPDIAPRPYAPISSAQAHEGLLSAFQKDLARLVAHVLGKQLPDDATRVQDFLDAVAAE
ncbi:MAG TPA: alkaline phosphatase family protein [Thermoanaerobaculaceae bacterium]|nr:alkaline phosphatase family protein [Thermoanaerobaculaceae bacterium]